MCMTALLNVLAKHQSKSHSMPVDSSQNEKKKKCVHVTAPSGGYSLGHSLLRCSSWTPPFTPLASLPSSSQLFPSLYLIIKSLFYIKPTMSLSAFWFSQTEQMIIVTAPVILTLYVFLFFL